ncbi:hypothetical protein VKT23_000283 [Stygiomarasmius scandens]|uniref:Uncharacterized protein n=1 Tax=Marasmiellus scandens TaxID=2682957 RepID=A0ABR1K5I3_9AGAR
MRFSRPNNVPPATVPAPASDEVIEDVEMTDADEPSCAQQQQQQQQQPTVDHPEDVQMLEPEEAMRTQELHVPTQLQQEGFRNFVLAIFMLYFFHLRESDPVRWPTRN